MTDFIASCKMDTVIKISLSPAQLAADLAKEISEMAAAASASKRPLTIALSGGSTPDLLFSELAEKHGEATDWNYVHFFWGDERCVPPGDDESNYGMARKTLLSRISVPEQNIHRIRGENDPEAESLRYAGEIMGKTRLRNNLPVFDLIILGLGGDGHTASIFPGDKDSLVTGDICAVARHPSTGQYRITLTARVINNADNIVFLVTGSNKAQIAAEIIERPGILDYPAAFIEPSHGILKWYLDTDAASMLSQWA